MVHPFCKKNQAFEDFYVGLLLKVFKSQAKAFPSFFASSLSLYTLRYSILAQFGAITLLRSVKKLRSHFELMATAIPSWQSGNGKTAALALLTQ